MFGAKSKTKKSEAPDKDRFTIFTKNFLYFKISQLVLYLRTLLYIDVISIDYAYKNFAFLYERRHFDGKVETFVFTKTDLTLDYVEVKEESEGESLMSHVHRGAIKLINSYNIDMGKIHVFISERQLQENYRTVRLSQHVIANIVSMMSSNAVMIEIHSKMKTKMNGAPKKLDKNGIKKFCIEFAIQTLNARGDEIALSVMVNSKGKRGKKMDDLADTICQSIAFFKSIELLIWHPRASLPSHSTTPPPPSSLPPSSKSSPPRSSSESLPPPSSSASIISSKPGIVISPHSSLLSLSSSSLLSLSSSSLLSSSPLSMISSKIMISPSHITPSPLSSRSSSSPSVVSSRSSSSSSIVSPLYSSSLINIVTSAPPLPSPPSSLTPHPPSSKPSPAPLSSSMSLPSHISYPSFPSQSLSPGIVIDVPSLYMQKSLRIEIAK